MNERKPKLTEMKLTTSHAALHAQAGTVNELPAGSRWLDIFAGTGSVGLEALSRGAAQCHFVEADAWVTKKILGKNIQSCGFSGASVVHSTKAEDFLKKARGVTLFFIVQLWRKIVENGSRFGARHARPLSSAS